MEGPSLSRSFTQARQSDRRLYLYVNAYTQQTPIEYIFIRTDKDTNTVADTETEAE